MFEREIEREIERHAVQFAEQVALLDTIPGIDRIAACALIAEIGANNMAQFHPAREPLVARPHRTGRLDRLACQKHISRIRVPARHGPPRQEAGSHRGRSFGPAHRVAHAHRAQAIPGPRPGLLRTLPSRAGQTLPHWEARTSWLRGYAANPGCPSLERSGDFRKSIPTGRKTRASGCGQSILKRRRSPRHRPFENRSSTAGASCRRMRSMNGRWPRVASCTPGTARSRKLRPLERRIAPNVNGRQTGPVRPF